MSTLEKSSANEGLPILPHLAAEFATWLWWASEDGGGHFEIDGIDVPVALWVDDRLAFRNPADSKPTAILTGENPATSREARAALSGGKVVQELRLRMGIGEQETTFTLKGPYLDLAAAKLPAAVDEGDGMVYDRMFLYGRVCTVVSALFRTFAELRASPRWEAEVVPKIREWVR